MDADVEQRRLVAVTRTAVRLSTSGARHEAAASSLQTPTEMVGQVGQNTDCAKPGDRLAFRPMGCTSDEALPGQIMALERPHPALWKYYILSAIAAGPGVLFALPYQIGRAHV